MVKVTRSKNNKLRSGRPPLSKGHETQKPGISRPVVNARRKSSKATRTLISKHHVLHKERAAALASGDHKLVKDIGEQIDKLGGLEAYQAASLTGQDKDRGGDSSEKLVEWLRKYDLVGASCEINTDGGLRVLEVGALSSKNTISGMVGQGVESVKRIDLHSQDPGTIEEVDFMQFPIPGTTNGKYDILSLSLVLNYVPEATQRGEMLRRTTSFLKPPVSTDGNVIDSEHQSPLSCLFLVLPLPCLTNSRYTTHGQLFAIMESLGYELLQRHDSQKLAYMLFRWHRVDRTKAGQVKTFRKIEINPGRTRNNFAIVLNVT